MNKKQKSRIETKRAAFIAEHARVPQMPTNLYALVAKLKNIETFYTRIADHSNQVYISSLLSRITSRLSQIERLRFSFRHLPLSRNAQYAAMVHRLIALCQQAEEIPCPRPMMLESAKERLRQRILECNAEGVLPDTDPTVVRLTSRIIELTHLAER